MKYYLALLSIPITALVVFIVIFSILSTNHQQRLDSFYRHWEEQGGHIYGPEVVFCITEDGRFIEVYP